MSSQLPPPPPPALKSVQHHLKTALEHDRREPIVAYYCRLYVLQKGMELDKSSTEAKIFLSALMTQMEQMKMQLSGEEAITAETVGHAYIENYALKMFAFADSEDRASRHTKNVVKSFYTAGMLFDVLSVFGECTEDIEKYKKYAKYKAAYIHKCLKSGQVPIPGPVGEEGEDLGFGNMSLMPHDASGATGGAGFSGGSAGASAASPGAGYHQDKRSSAGGAPGYGHTDYSSTDEPSASASASDDVGFDVDWEKATKYTKFALSSLTYEDRDSAIDYLMKSLNLLKCGHE